MANRTQHRDIERSITQALSEFSIEFSVQHWTSDRTAIVNVSLNSYDMTYQMAWLPHATLSELSRVDQRDRAHPLLVTGPQITSRTAEALRSAAIDYIDYIGNAHLEFGSVLVDIRGRRSSSKERSHRSMDANLFSARRMQVLFVLLAWPALAGTSVRKIAEAAGTSVGIAQSTLEIMKESDYLIGKSLQRRNELLDLWAAAFQGSLLPKVRRRAFSGNIEGWSPPPGCFVSGESAVELIRHPQTLTIYVEHFDLTEAIRYGWQNSDNPNIEVRKKFWEEPNWAGPYDEQGLFGRSAAPPSWSMQIFWRPRSHDNPRWPEP